MGGHLAEEAEGFSAQRKEVTPPTIPHAYIPLSQSLTIVGKKRKPRNRDNTFFQETLWKKGKIEMIFWKNQEGVSLLRGRKLPHQNAKLTCHSFTDVLLNVGGYCNSPHPCGKMRIEDRTSRR